MDGGEKDTLMGALKSPHLRAWGNVVRAGYWPAFRKRHPHLPFWSLLEKVSKEAKNLPSSKIEFLGVWTDLVSQMAMSGRTYTTADMDWLLEVLDGDPAEARSIIGMILAYASAPRGLTPKEAEEVGGLSDDRYKA